MARKPSTGTTARKPAPATPEARAAKFREVAVPRVNKAIKAIQLCTLTNRKQYDFTAEQVTAIKTALLAELDNFETAMTAALAGKPASASGSFKL